MNLSRLDGLDSISRNFRKEMQKSALPQTTLPKPYITTGRGLLARMRRASMEGLGDPSSNPIIIAAHNIDGEIIFESENGVFYDSDGDQLAVDGLDGIFKKIANTVKNVTQTVTKAVVSAAKVVTTPIRLPLNAAQNVLKGQSLKEAVKNANNKAKSEFKQFVSDTGKVIKLANKFFPVTILLRNGLLIILKLNLFGVAEKLKYAYLTDAQASAQGIDPASLSKVRGLEETIAKIYEGAGGNKENLKRAIINGKGNSDKNGKLNFNLQPATEYADSEEYRILEEKAVPVEFAGELAPEVIASDPDLAKKMEAAKLSGLGQLGDPATGASIAAGTSAIAAIAAKLKSIGEIFKKGQSIVKGAKSTVDTVKGLVPKKQPAPLPDSPTADQTAAYIAQQQAFDDYEAQVIAAGGTIQPNGTIMLPTLNRDGTTTPKSITPSGTEGMGTTAKVAIGLTALAAIGTTVYFATRNKKTPSRANLSGVPAKKQYKSVTARKKPSSSKKSRLKSKVKNVSI